MVGSIRLRPRTFPAVASCAVTLDLHTSRSVTPFVFRSSSARLQISQGIAEGHSRSISTPSALSVPRLHSSLSHLLVDALIVLQETDSGIVVCSGRPCADAVAYRASTS